MASSKTLALTLRLVDYSETSQIITVYTREFGRIGLLAKGSKRARHGVQTSVDILQMLEIVFIERSGSQLDLLTEHQLLEDYSGLREDLEHGYAGFFIAELLQSMTEEHDPNPVIFELAALTLGMLCHADRPNAVLYAFEVKLLRLIGLLPRLDGCAWCGGPLPTSTEVIFAPGAGGTICPKCRDHVPERIYVSRGALAVLNKLSTTPLNKVERLRISGTIAQDVRKILSRLWMHIMGREPRMLKYLH